MSEKRKKGFTLLELVIVILLIGILASLALPGFSRSKEDALDKEAKATLKLIQAAEKIYKMEIGNYYPEDGSIIGNTTANLLLINDNLKLSLTSSDSRNWNYAVWNTSCSAAVRNEANGRTWSLTINDTDGEPDAGLQCP